MPQGIELLSKEEIIETVVPDWAFIVPVLYVIAVVGIAFCLFLIGKYFDKRELGLIAILVIFLHVNVSDAANSYTCTYLLYVCLEISVTV